MSRRLRLTLYFLFADFCLFGALLLTFPYETLARRLEFEARRTPQTSLTIGEIGPALPFGLRLGDVTYQREAADSVPERKLVLDEVRLTPAVTSLFTGRAGVDFGVSTLGGTVKGRASAGPRGKRLALEMQGLDLGGDQFLAPTLGLQLGGRLEGTIEAATDADGVVESGKVAVKVVEAMLKGGKAAGITLPPMQLGEPVLEAEIADGNARVTKLDARSPDVEISANASATLKADTALSPLKGSLRFKPSASLMGRAPAVAAMVSLAGASKRADNTVELPLGGTIGNPRVVPGVVR